MKKHFLFTFMILSVIFIPSFGYSGDVKISWIANTETDFSFYRVYYGNASRNYGIPIKVSGKTEYTISLPDDGNTYYFAVTAVDNVGNESGYSTEVSKKMDAPSTGAVPIGVINNLIVASGNSYVVNANLAEGSQVYYDNTRYVYSNVPQELLGAIFIQPTYLDISYKDNNSFISFDLNAEATIYVVLDDRSSSKPFGMADFVDTGYDFLIYKNMSVYKKDFKAGSVVFGTNVDGNMYTIIVMPSQNIPLPDTQSPELMISSPTSTGSYQTKNNTLNLSGTANDNVEVVKVSWFSDNGSSGTASGTESWSISGLVLVEGLNNITIKAEDASGNSTNLGLAVTYTPPDTEVPSIVINLPTSTGDYETEKAVVDISGSSSDNTGVTIITWSNDRGGSGEAYGTDSWSISSVSLVEGQNIIKITAKDAAGNQSNVQLSVTYLKPVMVADELISNLTIASGNPYVIKDSLVEGSQVYYDSNYVYSNVPQELLGATFIQPTYLDISYKNSNSFISFDLNADATIYAVIDDRSSSKPFGMTDFVDTGYDFLIYRNMSVYEKAFKAGPIVFGTNDGGNMYTIIVVPSQSLLVPDTQPPEVIISSPTSTGSYLTKNDSLNIFGTASDNIEVTEVSWSSDNGSNGTAVGTESWSISAFPLTEGQNSITVKAEDAAGNSSSSVFVVTYTPPDTQPPSILIKSPVAGGSYETDEPIISIAGIASDNTGVQVVAWANSEGGSGLASGTENWMISNVPLVEGINYVSIVAMDSAGNKESETLIVTYTPPDIEAPNVVINFPTNSGDYETEKAVVDISGSSNDNTGVVEVTWSNDRGGSGKASGTGSWSISSASLMEGQNIIKITAKDAAGNQSDVQLSVIYSKPLIGAAELISNLTIASGNPYVIKDSLAEGSQVYYDNTRYVYSNIPQELLGAAFIQPTYRDISYKKNNSFISFDLNADATIYAVIDDRSSSKPFGMTDFVDTGYDFLIYKNMSVYKKSFKTGSVVFGTNIGGSMYTIILVQ